MAPKRGIGKQGKDNGVLLVSCVTGTGVPLRSRLRFRRRYNRYRNQPYRTAISCSSLPEGNYGEGLYDTVVALGDQIPSATNRCLFVVTITMKVTPHQHSRVFGAILAHRLVWVAALAHNSACNNWV